MPKVVLADTCIWYSIYNNRDCINQADIDALVDIMNGMTILMPWPVTYETLRTRFSKNKASMIEFEALLRSSNVVQFDDSPYREKAKAQCFMSAKIGRSLSLVDCLLRELLDDINVGVDLFVSDNKDDFADVCASRGIDLTGLKEP